MQPPLTTVSKVQYWFANVESGTANAIIKLYWIPGDYALASYMNTISNLVVARWDTLAPLVPGPRPAWLTAGVSAVQPGATYNSGWIQSAVVTAAQYGTSTVNRPFTLGSLTQDNSLPVEMGPFAARQLQNSIALDWTTFSEIQLLGFELDRTKESIVADAGRDSPVVVGTYSNDTALQAKSPFGANYRTIDTNALSNGRYTYDLYEIDKDGVRTQVASQSIDYSEIDIPSTVDLSVYPNPATSSVRAEFGLPADAYVRLDLYDITGREVTQGIDGNFIAGQNVVSIDVSNLATGAYDLVLSYGNQRLVKGIVIQK
jgi:hypothetical protein